MQRLPLAIKPHVIDGVAELEALFWESGKEYPQSISCPGCKKPLEFQELKLAWLVGPHPQEFLCGDVPGYECEVCEKVYLQRKVFESYTAAIEKDAKEIYQEHPFEKPDWLEVIDD